MGTGRGQVTRAIRTTTVYDVPVPEKVVALRATDGTLPTITWTMTDPQGLPVDLTDCVAGGSVPVVLAAREASSASGTSYVADATCADPANGVVTSTVDVSVFDGPGIFRCEFGVLGASGPGGVPLFTNSFYLVVEPSLFGNNPGVGPLTVPEMRLHLRDSSPAENRLTDAVEFDDAEYAAAMVAAVDYWNDALPPLDVRHTTQTFPYRYQWKEGAAAGLYRIAASWYRKNHLAYQSGGLGVDDLDKAQDCEAVADKKWADYKEWVLQNKVSINADACWGTAESPYSGTWGWVG